MKAKCKKCLYEWNCKSKLIKVSCPSCGSKVVLRKGIKDNKDGKK